MDSTVYINSQNHVNLKLKMSGLTLPYDLVVLKAVWLKRRTHCPARPGVGSMSIIGAGSFGGENSQEDGKR